MMRLACMSLSLKRAFSNGDMDLFTYIDMSRSLGLDGVDLHGSHFTSREPDYLWQLKTACIRRGLSLACVSIPNNFAVAPAELPVQVQMTHDLIDAAAFLGAPVVRVFAGWSENKDGGTWHRVVDSLADVAEYGNRRGVVVGLQNHNHGGVAATGPDVLRLLDDVHHANLSHVLDTGQYLDRYEGIGLTAARAAHVRCKVLRNRHWPRGPT